MLSTQQSLADLRPAEIKIEERLNQLIKHADVLPNKPDWIEPIQKYLIPSLQSPHQNLVITIVGATNVGKSLIFNSLPVLFSGRDETRPELPSSISFDADSTARPVLMFSADLFDESGNFDVRFSPTERWKNVEQVANPGVPLVYPVKDFYKHTVFVDTPAFGVVPDGYQQLDSTDLAVRSDILIYVFSNANYSDKGNLEALRQTLQRVGPRDLILVYNVNAAISPVVAERHADLVSRYLQSSFEIHSEAPPSRVLASYHMVHSERIAAGHDKVSLIPIAGSRPFAELLSILDSDYFLQRRQALNFTLKHVLEQAKQSFSAVERSDSEIDLTERILMNYLDYLIAETTKNVPYDRMGEDLEQTWHKQSPGLRGFTHWVANPLAMAGLTGRFTNQKSDSVGEVERSLENIVDTIVADFRLAIAENKIKVPKDDPFARQMIESVDKFRSEFLVSGADVLPNYKFDGDNLEVHLPIKSPALQAHLEEYAQRHWSATIAQIKQASKESFANLSLEVQTKLKDLVHQQGLPHRTAQSVFTGLTILTVASAISFVAYRGKSVAEMESLIAIVVAYLLARLFVSLEHRSLNKSWDRLIKNWFAERQNPRLREILANQVRFRPTSAKPGVDIASVQRVIDQLEDTGMVLKSPDQ